MDTEITLMLFLVSGVLDFVQLNTDEVVLYFADFFMVHRNYTNHCILAILL
jgi:hypothetical protein